MSELQERLEAALARHRVVGASAALWRDGQLHTAAAGLTNVTTDVAVDERTVMHIGSITKVFNATLLMQLVDEGQVELDTPVLAYLPDLQLADREALERITVKMLVNHTSGIDGEMIPDAGPDKERIADAIPRMADMGQIHAPGADTSYCNSAVVIAGYLVQALTGTSWYDLVRTKIYAPLGMQHAIAWPTDALLHRASVGHHLNPQTGEQVRTSFVFLPQSFAPAGATLMMSASDLVTFARAHLGDGEGPNGARILSAESARRMREDVFWPQVFDSSGRGLGWGVARDGMVSHGGGAPGALAMLYAHPRHDFALAVLTNSEHGLTVINEIAAPLIGEATGIDPANSALSLSVPEDHVPPEVDVQRYVGVYENLMMRFRVVPLDGGLGLSMQGKHKVYDWSATDDPGVMPLVAINDKLFIAQSAPHSPMAALAPGGKLPLAFINPDDTGAMQHISALGRLYRRIS